MEDNAMEQVNETPLEQTETTIDPEILQNHIQELLMQQNFPMALIAGVVAAIIGGILWAFITVTTKYQIGYMAVGVGFLVGMSVKYFGKGIESKFGIAGAILALTGCLLGNFFSIIGFASEELSTGIFETISSIDFSVIPNIMIESFGGMDLLFYGIAVYEGYRFSFTTIEMPAAN